MPVQMFKLAFTQIWWDMKEFVFLKLLKFIDPITVWIRSQHFEPSAIFFVLLFRRVTTTASEWIMFHLDSFLCFDKCFLNFLSTENISVEMLAKDLRCLIFNCILRVNSNDVINSHFKKSLAYFLRVTWIDKHHLRKKIDTIPQGLNDFFSSHNLQCAKNCPWIILKFESPFLCSMANYM